MALLTLKKWQFFASISLSAPLLLLLGLDGLLSSAVTAPVQASCFSSFSMGLNSFTPWWWRMSHLSSRGLRGPFCLQRKLWARRQRLFCFPFLCFLMTEKKVKLCQRIQAWLFKWNNISSIFMGLGTLCLRTLHLWMLHLRKLELWKF